ncbi:uncharacterized protein LOC116171931 [Photinus pyralis]|uniref:uncharacterized protein LOC116171931 n=1 Tax=Photinus pyralis TaxID=7054 RepID=UPI0012671543|nr:uncharacterized protein LOC116171931 [Photinus pyralis]
MVTQSNLHTLEDLARLELDDEDENIILSRIKELAVAHLPEGWKKWKVNNLLKKELLNGEMDSQILNKIRYALPTVGLIQAFNPEAISISEKKYREIKVKMLDWPFCIGLIIGPSSLAAKIRGSLAQNELALAALTDLKPLLISRLEASRQLEADSDAESINTRPSVSSKASKKSRLDALEKSNEDLKNMLASVLDRLNDTRPSSSYSLSDDGKENLQPFSEEEEDEVSWKAPSIADAPPMEWDFTPQTKEQEPLVPAPKPTIEKQGIQCQRLESTSFNKIRYAEVQKKFQAYPVFSALKVNPQLLGISSTNDNHLARSDSTLGSITHGLLLQREAFAEALKNLISKYPSIASEARSIFVDGHSEFRSISDDLLQYTCGRRAEIIDLRRKAFRPKSESITPMFNAIPPSSTHLFEEVAFTELAKQHGHFFRAPARSGYAAPHAYKGAKPPFSSNSNTGGRAQSKPWPSRNTWKRPSESRSSRNQPSSGSYKPREGGVDKKDKGRNDAISSGFKGGRLQKFVNSWISARAPDAILKTVLGYSIPFVKRPPLIRFSGKHLYHFASHGLSQEIEIMRQQGILQPSAHTTGFLSRMFAVPKSDGTLRPVLNLKRLNAHLLP